MAANQNVGLGNEIDSRTYTSQIGGMMYSPLISVGGAGNILYSTPQGSTQGYTSLDEGRNSQDPTGSLGLGIGGGSGSGGAVSRADIPEQSALSSLLSPKQNNALPILFVAAGVMFLVFAIIKKKRKKAK